MPKKTKAQGLSINAIILVVIGLIVLVVLIAILTGRMGLFSKGLESAASCENTCKAIGMDDMVILDQTKDWCNQATMAGKKFRYIPGEYSDVQEGKVCCCRGNV